MPSLSFGACRRAGGLTGRAIVASGYPAVATAPLHWHGRCFGALNLFRAEADVDGATTMDCQPFADAATMLILSTHLAERDLTVSLRKALEARAVVERAKGALARRGPWTCRRRSMRS